VTATATTEPCETCGRPKPACVCDRVERLATKRRVLVLQHPQEQDALLGSAQLLDASLPSVKRVVGLSWRNLGHALGEPEAEPRRWAVLFPDAKREGDAQAGEVTGRAESRDPADLDGIVVLDGTWSKAKTLWWRNPWLNKLPRLTLEPQEPSIYGRLRHEPRRDYVSTLESVAAALTLCGEDPAVEASLKRLFRTLVQRVRDANLVPPPAVRAARKQRAARLQRAAKQPK
jgi:DTW domain-containing protein YfiP